MAHISTPRREKYIFDDEATPPRWYRIVAEQGRGDTAVVYEVIEEITPEAAPEPERLAAKVPLDYGNTGLVGQERRIIQDIRKYSGERFCVKVHDGGQAADINKQLLEVPVLLAELVDQEYALFSRYKKGGLEADTALRLAEQYADLLGIVHDKLRQTCGDRKVTDLYWVPGRGLIVLDWNVTRPREDPKVASTEKLAHEQVLLQADICNFGRLWSRYLLGYIPRKIPEADTPLADIPLAEAPDAARLWDALPLGLRRILCRTLDDRPGRRYKRVIDWRRDLETFRNRFDETSADVLLQFAADEKKSAAIDPTKACESVADLTDLVLRRPALIQELKKQADVLRDWATQMEKVRTEEVAGILSHARGDISEGRYAKAKPALEQATANGKLVWREGELLRRQRWLTLAEALLEGERTAKSDASILHTLMKARPGLVKAVEYLEQEAWDDAWQCVKKETDTLPPDVHLTAPLEPLLSEVALRRAIEKARQAENPEGPGQYRTSWLKADGEYREVERLLGGFAAQAAVYHDRLLACLPGLLAHVAEIRQNAEAEQAGLTAQAKREKAEQRVTELLSDALNTPSAKWPEALVGVLAEVDEPLRVNPLAVICRTMAEERYALALRTAQDLADSNPRWDPANHALKLCLRIARERAQYVASKGFRLDEILEGIELCQLLLDPVDAELRKAVEEPLKDRQTWHSELLAMLGDPPNPIAHLDDDQGRQLDEKLQKVPVSMAPLVLVEAIKGGKDWTPDRVRRVRDAARFKKSLEHLTGELAKLIAQLEGQKGVLEKLANDLEGLQQKRGELEAQLQVAFDPKQLKELEERAAFIGRLQQLVTDPGALAATEGALKAYEEKVDGLQKRFDHAKKKHAELTKSANEGSKEADQLKTELVPAIRPDVDLDAAAGAVEERRRQSAESSVLSVASLASGATDAQQTIKELRKRMQDLTSYNELSTIDQQLTSAKSIRGISALDMEHLTDLTKTLDELKTMANLSKELQRIAPMLRTTPPKSSAMDGLMKDLGRIADEIPRLLRDERDGYPVCCWRELSGSLREAFEPNFNQIQGYLPPDKRLPVGRTMWTTLTGVRAELDRRLGAIS